MSGSPATDTVGEVTEVKGKKLQIISDSLKMSVDIDRTEPVDAAAYMKETGKEPSAAEDRLVLELQEEPVQSGDRCQGNANGGGSAGGAGVH